MAQLGVCRPASATHECPPWKSTGNQQTPVPDNVDSEPGKAEFYHGPLAEFKH